MLLPSAAPSQGVGEGTPRAEAAQPRAMRVTFLIAVTKCSTKVRMHDRFILAQFKHAESIGVAGAWGGWSQCNHGQDAERDGATLSSRDGAAHIQGKSLHLLS